MWRRVRMGRIRWRASPAPSLGFTRCDGSVWGGSSSPADDGVSECADDAAAGGLHGRCDADVRCEGRLRAGEHARVHEEIRRGVCEVDRANPGLRNPENQIGVAYPVRFCPETPISCIRRKSGGPPRSRPMRRGWSPLRRMVWLLHQNGYTKTTERHYRSEE